MEDAIRETAPPSDQAYAAFFEASRAGWMGYRTAFRGRSARLEPDQAQKHVRDFIDRLTGDLALTQRELAALLIPRAVADPDLSGLGLVAVALLAMRTERFAEAAELAERAYSADQHETFAQRLFLAAREKRPDLRLEVDDWLADRFCPNPFTDLEVIQSGDLFTCCAAWLPAPIGSAHETGSDPWVSDRAQELRRSILDGDFSYCSRLSCPRIAGRSLPRRAEVTDHVLVEHITTHGQSNLPGPDRVLLSYDTSCNLSCPSCRTKTISLGRVAARTLDAFYDEKVAPLLETASRIKITGSGDPFGSNHFRHVLKALTAEPAAEPRLQLQTNGVLFDQRAWEELKLEGHVRSVWISVDASDAETYKILRRGGDFERLLANLRFLGGLRAEGRIGELRLDMVVQEANFRQMPDFADLAEEVGADGVHFLMLRNWGTFTPAEFRQKAIAFDDHPDHGALLEVLNDPRLDRKGVDLGNLGTLREKSRTPTSPAISSDPDAPPLGDPEAARIVLLLGIPRSGSNYVFGCLDRVPDLYVLREVFSPVGAFGMITQNRSGLRHFSRELKRNLRSELDKTFVAHVHAHPIETLRDLRALAAGMGRKAAALKIFPDQIDDAVLTGEILADPAVIPVVLRRQLLASYISWIKARTTKAWVRRDLTAFRPEIDVDDYLRWQEKTTSWFRMLENTLAEHGKQTVEIDYETFTSTEPIAALASLLDGIGKAGLSLGMPAAHLSPPIPRQDWESDPFARVSNGETLRAAIESRGLCKIALSLP